jgi:hypothetical protein
MDVTAQTATNIVANSIRLLKSETKQIDKALVDRFATMTPSITERPLDDSRVDYLANKVVEGAAIPFLWSYARLDGKDYRINGQHSSHALAQMNGNMPENLVAHVDEYEVKDEAELVHLFRQFDARKSGRSPLDVANAYASVVPGLAGIPREILKLGAEGINWGRGAVDGLQARKADDRYIEMTLPQNLDFLQGLGAIFSIKTPELRSLPVVAAQYKTHFIDPDRSAKFWSSVARGGDEFDETDPARALDTWLRDLKSKSNRLVVRPLQIYQACIFAWNAEMDGKPLTKILYDVKKGLFDPKYPA